MKNPTCFLVAAIALSVAAWEAIAQQAQPAPQVAVAETARTNAVLAATETWRPIAADLRAGGILQVSAAGVWRITPQFNPNSDVTALRTLAGDAGPDGYTELPLSQDVILPTAPVAALIGRIGERGAPFLIGSQYSAEIASDGDLFVSINDAPGQFADNAGRLSIQVAFTPPPPRPAPEQPPSTEPLAEEPGAFVESPAPEARRPAVSPGLITAGLIGAAILLAILLAGALFGRRSPRADANERGNPAAPQVTTRVVSDGIAGQSLTLTLRGR